MNSTGFQAVSGSDARVLILGTLPGALSLEKQQYYAQSRNSFWPIMGAIAGVDSNLPYEDRVRLLVEKRFALWDVCSSAQRMGSLDSAIQTESVHPNDFPHFFARHRELRLVCFNGAKASALFKRLVRPRLPTQYASLKCVTLPSTSPANAAMPLADKIRLWRAALID